MPPIRLTQRRVDALRPRRKVRDIRDAELKGYGVRVMPSGATRYFVHSQHRGKRIWKIIGDAAAIAEPEARARARAMLAALRDGQEPEAAEPGETLFETVAEEVFDRYGRRWKPRTMDANRAYLRRQILPFVRGQAHRRDNPGGGAGPNRIGGRNQDSAQTALNHEPNVVDGVSISILLSFSSGRAHPSLPGWSPITQVRGMIFSNSRLQFGACPGRWCNGPASYAASGG